MYQIGDIVARRTILSTQRVRRDRRRGEAGPDHVLSQLRRTRRYQGTIAGRAASVSSGIAAIIGRRHLVDGVFDHAVSLGIIVPCTHLHALPVEDHGLLLDAARNRLLAAHIPSVHRRLPITRRDDAPALSDEMVAVLRRLLDPSRATDVLEGGELDGGLLALARTIVRAD